MYKMFLRRSFETLLQNKNRKKEHKRKVRLITDDSDSDVVFAVHEKLKSNIITVRCRNVSQGVMVDYGASCNIVGKSTSGFTLNPDK